MICQDLSQNCPLSAKRKYILSMFLHVRVFFFFFFRGCEECFEASMDAKGYESSCKNISLKPPPMQQALCVCVSKTDPVAAIPSPYPATTPPPRPCIRLHFVRSDCVAIAKGLQVFIWTLSTPRWLGYVMWKEQCVLHYFESSALLFKKVLEATGTPRR